MKTNKLIEYINLEEKNMPIFIDDLFNNVLKDNQIDRKVFNVNIARLVSMNIIKRYKRGIYYVPANTVFGETKLNAYDVISKKYLRDGNELNGYISGLTLLRKMGLTNLETKYINITTKKVSGNRIDHLNNVKLTKALQELNSDNYIYFQVLDLLIEENKFDISEIDFYKGIAKYLTDNNADFMKLFKYLDKYNMNKIAHKLARLGQVLAE